MTATVNLRVYDISGGAAKRWSSILLGRQIHGVWHSGIEVFGFEYFYGGGIVKMKPENVELTFGISPNCIHCLGETSMSRSEFERFLISVMPMFKRELYNLTDWNCNHFTNHCARELVRKSIPAYILDLPDEVGKTFIGKLLLNFLKMISGGGSAAPIAVPAAPPPMRRSSARTIQQQEQATGGMVRCQSERADRIARCRRNSCPTVIPKPPACNVSLPAAAVPRVGKNLARPQETKLTRIAGSPLTGAKGVEVPTEILLSPVHKHLYEIERNLYTNSTPPPGASTDTNVPPTQQTRQRRSSVCV